MTLKVSELYPSKWISHEDITRPTAVTIAAVRPEQLRERDGTKTTKLVLTFHRAKKELILNATQAKALAAILGDNAEAWPGHTITLAPAMTSNRQPTIAVSAPPQPMQPANGHATTPAAEEKPDPDPDPSGWDDLHGGGTQAGK